MENFYRSILKQTLTQLKKMEQTKTILSSIKAIESIPFHETDLEDEYFVRLYFLIKNSERSILTNGNFNDSLTTFNAKLSLFCSIFLQSYALYYFL